MKRIEIRYFVLTVVFSLFGLTASPAISSASADNCPENVNLQLVPFTFDLDTSYQSQSPLFQGFTSNYFANLGAINSKKMSVPFMPEDINASHVALAYLSSGNDQELSKVNGDISTGYFMEQWNKGAYFKNLSRGSYPYLLSQLDTDVVIESGLQFSNDGSSWTESTVPTDPFWIQKMGFGNGSYARYFFQISVKGCQNPFKLSTNSMKILGINTTPLPTSDLIKHITSIGNKNPEDAGYFKGDRLSFKFNDFLGQEKFMARYSNWIDSSVKTLESFDWSHGSFNVRTISLGWYALGSNSVNMNIVGMQPSGCLQNSASDFAVVTLLKDCQLGIYVQSAYQDWEKYSRYILVGEVNAKLKPKQITPSPIPQPSSSAADKEAKAPMAKKSTIYCIKGKVTKKVTAVKPFCPSGYKKK